MKCPSCNKEISIKAKDVVYGHNDKRYDRSIYNCEDCDSWVTEEIPIIEKQK